jgi:hypothetical protein
VAGTVVEVLKSKTKRKRQKDMRTNRQIDKLIKKRQFCKWTIGQKYVKTNRERKREKERERERERETYKPDTRYPVRRNSLRILKDKAQSMTIHKFPD